MPSYREIVTKTVLGKGKKKFVNHYTLTPEEIPSTILGCWVINHNFEGIKENEKIRVRGNSDVNIWYSYDNDTKTLVSKQTISYDELLTVNKNKESETKKIDIIIRSLKDPACIKVEIIDGKIEYDIEKELGIELIGDAKVKIAVDEAEDEWEEILDETKEEKNLEKELEEKINEKFINDNK